MSRWKAQLLFLVVGISFLSVFLYRSWDALDSDWKPADHRSIRRTTHELQEFLQFAEDGEAPLVLITARDSTDTVLPLLWILRNRSLYQKVNAIKPGLGYRRCLIAPQRLQNFARELMSHATDEGAITITLRGTQETKRLRTSRNQVMVLIAEHFGELAPSPIDLTGITVRSIHDGTATDDRMAPAWPTTKVDLTQCIDDEATKFPSRPLAKRLNSKSLSDGLYTYRGEVYRVWIRPLIAD